MQCETRMGRGLVFGIQEVRVPYSMRPHYPHAPSGRPVNEGGSAWLSTLEAVALNHLPGSPGAGTAMTSRFFRALKSSLPTCCKIHIVIHTGLDVAFGQNSRRICRVQMTHGGSAVTFLAQDRGITTIWLCSQRLVRAVHRRLESFELS